MSFSKIVLSLFMGGFLWSFGALSTPLLEEEEFSLPSTSSSLEEVDGSPHVSLDWRAHSELYHQALTLSHQQFFKKQYQSLALLDKQLETLEQHQEQAQHLQNIHHQISQQEENCKEHYRVLSIYKTLRDQEPALKVALQQKVDAYQQRLSQLNPTDSQYKVVQSGLGEAQKQVTILSIPLQNREFDLQFLKEHVKKLENEKTSDSVQSQSHLQQQRTLYLQQIQHLTELRAKTIYKNVPFLQKHQGYLFAQTYPVLLLKKFMPHGHGFLDKMDPEALWSYFVQSLELPDAKLIDTSDSIQTAYQCHIQSLIQLFKSRLQEDVLCFETLWGMFTGFNDYATHQKKPVLTIQTTVFDGREQDLFHHLSQTEEALPEQTDVEAASVLTTILGRQGCMLEESCLKPFLKAGVFGRLLGSLERGTFYSWQSPAWSLVRNARNNLKQNQDISKELMQAFYTLLGRLVNQQVLETIQMTLTPPSSPVPLASPKRQRLFIPFELKE